MAELKTKKTTVNVKDFINKIPYKQKREDSLAIVNLMKKVTKAKPKMWGSSIVGFVDVHLKYESGRELDWFKMGFSPRKQNLTLYIPEVVVKEQALLKKLGKHKTGRGCLYISKLEEVDIKVLEQIIKKGNK